MTEARRSEQDIDDAGPADQQAAGAASATPSVPRRLLSRTLSSAWDDDVFSESAAAAFWQTLSLPPLLLGIFGILGYIGGWFGPDTVTAVQQWIIDLTAGVFSSNAVDEIIVPTVTDILTIARGEVVSVGFLLSMWSGSSAMAAFVDAITRAHGQYQLRNLVWQRVLSVLLYLVGLATGIVLLPVAALGPRLLFLLPASWEPIAGVVLGTVYYPIVGLVLALALTTLYRIALPLKPPWYRGLPGALLAALVFLAGAGIVRLYLNWITSTGYTYGALGAPIAFLLATFIIALAIVLGAHLNSAVQEMWPAELHRRGKRVAHPQRPKTEQTAPADLTHAVRDDPDAAAAILESLDYVVTRPNRAAATISDATPAG
jgi:membrane protein